MNNRTKFCKTIQYDAKESTGDFKKGFYIIIGSIVNTFDPVLYFPMDVTVAVTLVYLDIQSITGPSIIVKTKIYSSFLCKIKWTARIYRPLLQPTTYVLFL